MTYAADGVLEARSILPEVIEGDADDYIEVSEPPEDGVKPGSDEVSTEVEDEISPPVEKGEETQQ